MIARVIIMKKLQLIGISIALSRMDSTSDQKKYFLQTISRYQGLINSVCKMYVVNKPDFEDMRQEVILQLWKSLPAFRHESKISTWIYRVAFNTLLSNKRDTKKHSNYLSLSEAEHDSLAVPVFADDEIQHLLFVISQLEDKDKAIVVLYLEGYSHKEIADILSFTTTNISTRMNRIKSRLKEMYKTSQHEPR